LNSPDFSKAIGNDVIEWSRCVDDRVSEPGQVAAQFRFNPMSGGAGEIVPVSATTNSRQPICIARVQEKKSCGRRSSNARQ
jgi:hypothetical protein